MLRGACATGVLFCLLVSTAAAQVGVKDSPYYPLQVGNRWTYRLGDRKYVQTVTKHQLTGKVLCALIESELGDASMGKELVASAEDGVFRYAFGMKAPIPAETPIRLLKLPPVKGESWTVDTKAANQRVQGTFTVGEEEITVPAGKFKAVTVTTTDLILANRKAAGTTWYARGVGIVKQVVSSGDTTITLELEKFEPGKP